MPSITSTRKQQQTLSWDYHHLFTRFCELASPSHPASSHIPPATLFPQTQWLLQSESKQKVWMKECMIDGIGMLTRALDQDWPEWAHQCTRTATRRPVQGLLPLARDPTCASDIVQYSTSIRATHVQPCTTAPHMGLVASEPSDDSGCMFQTITGREEREGGDASTSGELEDTGDIYVKRVL